MRSSANVCKTSPSSDDEKSQGIYAIEGTMFLTIASESPTFVCMVPQRSLVIATFIENAIMSLMLILYGTTMVNTVSLVPWRRELQ